MCGLSGTFSLFPLPDPLNLDPIRHRGPDGQGIWQSPDGLCRLGHTRLAIQDPSSSGSQPLSSHCGRWTIAYNGEIYNHLQLRSQLSTTSWFGHSDTETLVQGLAEKGICFLHQLQGMFAFAAYDSLNSCLYLVRDRFGIKPLYVHFSDLKISFSSEQRGLPVASTLLIDKSSVSQFLSFGHIFTPSVDEFDPTLMDRPFCIPPSTYLLLNRDLHPSFVKYYSISKGVKDRLSSSRLACNPHNTFRRLLETTVTQHLISDTPVSCFLSSGLDSGILAALAARSLPGKLQTFTVSFPGTPEDEGSRARWMADHCRSQHTEVTLTESLTCQYVEQALCSLDVPSADALNTYFISQAVSRCGIKVALSGLGADELFGGYPSHKLLPVYQLIKKLSPLLHNFIIPFLPFKYSRKLVDLPRLDLWHLTLASRRWLTDSELISAGSEPFRWPNSFDISSLDPWTQVSLAELAYYTEPMLLRDTDVMSMACGLEIRVPFLDHLLIEYTMSLPKSLFSAGKGFLREACLDLFPSGYLQQRKKGFALPMKSLMLGPLSSLCETRLQFLAETGFLDPHWLRSQWSLFMAGHLRWTNAWSLVVLGEFARRTRA